MTMRALIFHSETDTPNATECSVTDRVGSGFRASPAPNGRSSDEYAGSAAGVVFMRSQHAGAYNEPVPYRMPRVQCLGGNNLSLITRS